MKTQETPTPLAPIVTKLGKKVEAKCLGITAQLKKEKEKFLKDFDCPSYALEWCTDTLLQRHEEERLWMRAVAIVRREITEEAAMKAMLEEVANIAKHIITFPPRHNSTSEVANLNTLQKNIAMCGFVREMAMITGDFTYAT